MKMKKMTALICAILVSLAMFAGCTNKKGGESVPPSTPVESDDSAASDTDIKDHDDVKPSEPVDLPEPELGDTRDFEITLEGQKETVTMTYVKLEPAGGPAISLYVDLNRYEVKDYDGEYSIVPVGENIANVMVRFQWKDGMSAKEAMAEAKERVENYGDSILSEDEVKLDNYTAQYFSTEEGCAYCIDHDGGSLYIGASAAGEAAEGHFARIAEMLKTIAIA